MEPAMNVGNEVVKGICCLIVEIGCCMTGKTTGAATGTGLTEEVAADASRR